MGVLTPCPNMHLLFLMQVCLSSIPVTGFHAFFSWTEAISATFRYSTEDYPCILGDNFHPIKSHFIIKWLNSLKCHNKRLSPVLTYFDGFSFAFFFFLNIL